MDTRKIIKKTLKNLINKQFFFIFYRKDLILYKYNIRI